MTDYNAMTIKQLVSHYNVMAAELDDNTVLRFSSKAVGIKRCKQLEKRLARPKPSEEQLQVDPEAKGARCPHCGVKLANNYSEHDPETVKNDVRVFLCLHCHKEFGPKIKGLSIKRAAAIQKTWEDPEVKAKRSQRHAVRVVKGKRRYEFRSVRAAFVELDLPLKEHIRFRMALKAAGTAEAYDAQWEVIEA